jgi:hypothetical protein
MRGSDDERRSPDEITAEILEIVRAKPGDHIQNLVRRAVAAASFSTSREGPPFSGFRGENLEYAKSLRKWICAGIGDNGDKGSLVKKTPSATVFFGLWSRKGEVSAPDAVTRAFSRQNSLIDALKELRARCDVIIEEGPGVHKNVGHRQISAARLSRELMEGCGFEIAYSSPTSPYCKVARLIYELLTGEYDQDLERACETVARRPATGTESA